MILIIAELFNPLMADRTEENELPAVCLLGRNTGMH